MKTDPDLWRRIEAVELDELRVELPFSARLARDNGWSRDLADAVIEEYRRFCYLAVQRGRPDLAPAPDLHAPLLGSVRAGAGLKAVWRRFCRHSRQGRRRRLPGCPCLERGSMWGLRCRPVARAEDRHY